MRATYRDIASALALSGFLLAAPLSHGAMAQSAGQVETVIVNLDHARIIRLPEKTQTVIVGNPIIADVAVQKSGIMVVTAKSFGETNLIALDATGNMLAESKIIVKAARDSVVTVQRGMERESYACAPACQPAIQLGDNQKFFAETGGQATARNALAVPK